MAKTVAISIGDLNGIGFQIALAAHKSTAKLVKPLYCVSSENAKEAAKLLKTALPSDFNCIGTEQYVTINPGQVDARAGKASFDSFVQAVDLCVSKQADAMVTLPITKAAWKEARLPYKGHTTYLKERFGGGIMMLGCPQRYVLLYTEHIPLINVVPAIKFEALRDFLVDAKKYCPFGPIGVLGVNPHNGDHGAIGSEDDIVRKAVIAANDIVGSPFFEGPVVADAAFSPNYLKHYKVVVALYHDQGLAPLKALYFEESINITLGLPIVRTSVDHGTGYDIAYRDQKPSIKSYQNAIEIAVKGLTFSSN